MTEYLGCLVYSKMREYERAAYSSFHHQKQRCYNKHNIRYKNYGGKGVTVEYSVREFIGWYLENIIKFKGINPTVGRIDHARNYSFDNIEIQSKSDNSKERYDRLGSPIKESGVMALIDGVVYCFSSVKSAYYFTKVNIKNIYRICNGDCLKSKTNIFFVWENA